MIKLNNSLIIGEGSTRRCFQHPLDADLCIKIDNVDEEISPTLRESFFYEKLLKRQPNFDFKVIPAFHGFVDTSLGRGGVFDLCRSEIDGEVAPTLSQFLEEGLGEECKEQIKVALRVFCESLLQYWIVSTDLKSHNICVIECDDGCLRLVCIDGLGSKEHLPFCDIWPWWARRKIRRHIRRYHLDDLDQLIKYGAGLKPFVS